MSGLGKGSINASEMLPMKTLLLLLLQLVVIAEHLLFKVRSLVSKPALRIIYFHRINLCMLFPPLQ